MLVIKLKMIRLWKLFCFRGYVKLNYLVFVVSYICDLDVWVLCVKFISYDIIFKIYDI